MANRACFTYAHAEMKRSEEAQREMDFAVGLRPNDGNVPYNCACINKLFPPESA